MHTNETPNYHLPQFVGTDIINPLVDTNGAYSAIDTALKDISDNEVTDAGKILALETTVGDSSAGLVKDVADLQTQNGNSVLTTDAQTLSAAINEVDAHTDTNAGNIADNALAITGLQNTVGNANSGLVKEVADLKKINIIHENFSYDIPDTSVDIKTAFANALAAFKEYIANADKIKAVMVVGINCAVGYVDSRYNVFRNKTQIAADVLTFRETHVGSASDVVTLEAIVTTDPSTTTFSKRSFDGTSVTTDNIGNWICSAISMSNVTFAYNKYYEET